MKIYKQDDFSLRRFLPADWPLYKAIRLQALQTDPQVFGSNFDKEFTYTDEEWRNRLKDKSRAYFGLFHKSDLIGLTGVLTHQDDAEAALLVASFIQPSYRGRRLSALLHQARRDWAKARKFKRVIVSHRISNLASAAAVRRVGFVQTHAESKVWPDGVEADQVFYRLDLE